MKSKIFGKGQHRCSSLGSIIPVWALGNKTFEIIDNILAENRTKVSTNTSGGGSGQDSNWHVPKVVIPAQQPVWEALRVLGACCSQIARLKWPREDQRALAN